MEYQGTIAFDQNQPKEMCNRAFHPVERRNNKYKGEKNEQVKFRLEEETLQKKKKKNDSTGGSNTRALFPVHQKEKKKIEKGLEEIMMRKPKKIDIISH